MPSRWSISCCRARESSPPASILTCLPFLSRPVTTTFSALLMFTSIPGTLRHPSSLSTIPTREGDDHRDYHELHAVETADERIVVHIRNHNPRDARETLQTESEDGGRTWSEPHAIGVWGLPSHLLRLRDGRLLMSYGYRRPPFGNQARISGDGGRHWSDPLTISADGASGDLGYPSTAQLDDRSLVTVWYELPKGRDRAVLRMSHWRLRK